MDKPISCSFFREHLNAYLDGELDFNMKKQMERHAEQCAECFAQLDTMTRLLTMCAELDEGLAMPLEGQAAWRKAVREEAAKPAPHRAAHRGFTRAVAAVAASFVLLSGGTFAYRLSRSGFPRNQALNLNDAQSAARYTTVARTEAEPMPAMLLMEKDGETTEPARTIVGDFPVSTSPTAAPTQAPEETQQRVVARSARRTLRTDSFDQSLQSVRDLVSEYDGYFEKLELIGQAGGITAARSADLQVRVNVDQLDEFLLALGSAGTVTQQSEQAEDVSRNYYGVQGRIEAADALITRLTELTKSAANIDELLVLEDKLRTLQTEVDELKGEEQALQSQLRDATVTIRLEEVSGASLTSTESWKARVMSAFRASVRYTKNFLQDAAVVLAMAAPALIILIPVIVLILLIIGSVKRRKRKARQAGNK